MVLLLTDFKAYHLKESIISQANEVFKQKNKFDFQAGKAQSTSEYLKNTNNKEINVIRSIVRLRIVYMII